MTRKELVKNFSKAFFCSLLAVAIMTFLGWVVVKFSDVLRVNPWWLGGFLLMTIAFFLGFWLTVEYLSE